jgi:NAD(P)-dependent dehydrogenase (short-subunit alcohol dehydrogenase family)
MGEGVLALPGQSFQAIHPAGRAARRDHGPDRGRRRLNFRPLSRRHTPFAGVLSDGKASGARVVSVSSRGHRRAGVDFDDPHFERRAYDKWIAYGQSKTANALFALALDARGEAHRVRAFSVHPGSIITELMRSMSLPRPEAS